MIFTTEIEEIVKWVNENRPDQESEKPYFDYVEVDGGYELPEDGLIERGLNDLKQPYSIVIRTRGHEFRIDYQI